jgi:hypothetical protein
MKPLEKKPLIVYRIINKSNGAHVGSYSRSYYDEYDFVSASHQETQMYTGCLMM